jgi:hypothetical protein
VWLGNTLLIWQGVRAWLWRKPTLFSVPLNGADFAEQDLILLQIRQRIDALKAFAHLKV